MSREGTPFITSHESEGVSSLRSLNPFFFSMAYPALSTLAYAPRLGNLRAALTPRNVYNLFMAWRAQDRGRGGEGRGPLQRARRSQRSIPISALSKELPGWPLTPKGLKHGVKDVHVRMTCLEELKGSNVDGR